MSFGVAVVGYGAWGPNHVRNLLAMERCRLLWVCDSSPAALARIPAGVETLRTTTSLDEVLDDPEVQGVVVATPAPTHEQLASACLRAGKHVLVEKPLCADLPGARRLHDEAARVQRSLHVGHVCVHHPGVERARQLIEAGKLGELVSVDAVRTSRPPTHAGINVLWDLAVHDVSIFNAWMGAAPVEVAAIGQPSPAGAEVATVCATLVYPRGVLGRILASWRAPMKVRRCVATGTDAVVSFDDLAADATVTLDHGDGPQLVAGVEEGQPLRRELEHFLDAFGASIPSPTSAAAGVEVIQTLTALERSLAAGGQPEALA